MHRNLKLLSSTTKLAAASVKTFKTLYVCRIILFKSQSVHKKFFALVATCQHQGERTSTHPHLFETYTTRHQFVVTIRQNECTTKSVGDNEVDHTTEKWLFCCCQICHLCAH